METIMNVPTTGAIAKLRRRMLNPFLMRGFFLTKLPLALVAGLRLRELTEERCVATVPYGWRSTNPFRSTYFAALSMAAELSTGALAMAAVESAPKPVAMLITGLTASFEKKATGLTTFTCTEGPGLFEAVAQTIATGEPVAVEVPTVGTSPDGVVVARFTFTWSFKVRK
jgi:acyl-coenzyme A thioesterase PaaI-like protein